jgi:hypothetical protein
VRSRWRVLRRAVDKQTAEGGQHRRREVATLVGEKADLSLRGQLHFECLISGGGKTNQEDSFVCCCVATVGMEWVGLQSTRNELVMIITEIGRRLTASRRPPCCDLACQGMIFLSRTLLPRGSRCCVRVFTRRDPRNICPLLQSHELQSYLKAER